MRVVLLLAVVAVALGAVGIYRYESTRTVACGVVSAPIAVPVDANVTSWFARVYPANELRNGPSRRFLLATCQARVDAGNGEAQGAYLAYIALVTLGAATSLVAFWHRRKPAAE